MGKWHIPKYLCRKAEKKRVGCVALAVLLVLLAVLIGAVIGRYQRQFRSDGAVRAKEFYFTSDLLDGKTHTLAPGSTEITFTLGNHADELRFSEVDITYTVTVTSNNETEATVKNSEGNSTGTLPHDEKADEKITLSGLTAGTYTITAVGTGGYEETLTATIVIPGKAEELYQYQESIPGEYLLLTVWNEGDVAGEVTITYTGIPDNTNRNMRDWKKNEGAAGKKVTIGPHTSMVFRFFGGAVTVTDVKSDQVPVKDPA